jgi:hypothetical protein
MQHATQSDLLVTPNKYAKLRGLNRSTISRQIRAGKIRTHDGLLDPKEADRDRRQNLDLASNRKGRLAESTESKNERKFFYDFGYGCGMARLAESLRESGRIEALVDLMVEDFEIQKDKAIQIIRCIVFFVNVWIVDVLAETVGKSFSKKFDGELAAWLRETSK